jgi:ADP-ribose pyrophosphatase YjhB (NUDIX family)/nicotinamide mononucleotide adenylyltransferase
MNNKILFLSEFQPVHMGLEKVLQENISKDIIEVLFCIDWAYRKLSDETPFSTKEREDMISILMKKHNVQYNFLHLRDEDTDEWRALSIKNMLQPLSWITVLSDNKKTHEIVSWLWYDGKEVDSRWYTPGILRNQIASGHISALQHKIPQDIVDYIWSINWFERSRNMKINVFHGPSITVDVIARNKKWEIAIIDRWREPFGKALPGWFIDYAEWGSTAAARECIEETNTVWIFATTHHQAMVEKKISELLAKNEKQYPYEQQPFYVMTDPNRDKRGHLMTLWYIIDVQNANELTALDDAAWVQFMDPYVALDHSEIFTDHKTIIAAYIAQL